MKPLYGSLLVFEGIDGAGKSTLVNKAWHYLADWSVPVLDIKEPGNSYVSVCQDIRLMLFGAAYSRYLDDVTQGLLFFLDHYNNARFCEEQVEDGQIVLCDRWCYSQFAYDIAKPKPQKESLELYQKYENLLIKPDVVFLLEAEPHAAMNRAWANQRSKENRVKAWGHDIERMIDVQQEYMNIMYKQREKGQTWIEVPYGEEISIDRSFDEFVAPVLDGMFGDLYE